MDTSAVSYEGTEVSYMYVDSLSREGFSPIPASSLRSVRCVGGRDWEFVSCTLTPSFLLSRRQADEKDCQGPWKDCFCKLHGTLYDTNIRVLMVICIHIVCMYVCVCDHLTVNIGILWTVFAELQVLGGAHTKDAAAPFLQPKQDQEETGECGFDEERLALNLCMFLSVHVSHTCQRCMRAHISHISHHTYTHITHTAYVVCMHII